MQAPLRRLLTAVALALPAAVLLGAPAVAALPAADGGDDPNLVTFGISPAGPERPDDRPFLAYEAAPGSVINDHVALINQDARPLTLQTYASDVVQTPEGGLSALPRDKKNVDAGSWVTVGVAGDVTVPPASAKTGVGFAVVPLTITVPADIEPGDHVIGVVASLRSAGKAGAGAPDITLDQRVAARLYLRISGRMAPGVVVEHIDSRFEGNQLGHGSATITYTLHNTGNVRVGVRAAVAVAGPFGVGARTGKGKPVSDLLPGATATQTVTVQDVWAMGVNPVTVRAQVVAPTAGQDPGLGTVRGRSVLWATTYGQGAVALLVAGAVAWQVVRVRRLRAWNRYWLAQQAAAAAGLEGSDDGDGDAQGSDANADKDPAATTGAAL